MKSMVIGVTLLFVVGFALIVAFFHFQNYLLNGQSKVDGPYTTLTTSY